MQKVEGRRGGHQVGIINGVSLNVNRKETVGEQVVQTVAVRLCKGRKAA